MKPNPRQKLNKEPKTRPRDKLGKLNCLLKSKRKKQQLKLPEKLQKKRRDEGRKRLTPLQPSSKKKKKRRKKRRSDLSKRLTRKQRGSRQLRML